MIEGKEVVSTEGAVAAGPEDSARIGVRTAAGAKQEGGMNEATTQLITVLKETENEELRLQVARALASMKELPVQALLEGLDSYPDEVKPWAAGILAAIGEPATEPTINLVGPKSKSKQQMLWCVAALDGIGTRQAERRVTWLSEEEKPDQSQIDQVHSIKTRILSRK